jgi:hypothetical protein
MNKINFKNHQNTIIFEEIYPIKEIIFEDKIHSIKWAINEDIKNSTHMVIENNKVSFKNIHIRFLYLDKPNTIKSIVLSNGFEVTEEIEINNIFRRNDGWAGADGVFSHVFGNTIHWYFSDTLVGKVNKDTRQRESMIMVNNTIGISNINDPFNISFNVKKDLNDEYTSYYIPEKEGYYWLQDGCYKDGYLYISVIRVRDDKDLWFKVLGSEMIKVKINNDESLDYNNYTIFDNQTYFEIMDETYTFGAAVLDDIARTGFYYMFGYDNSVDKNLYMVRVKDFENDETYEYYTNNGWSKIPIDFKSIGKHVANEMRVIYDDKYIISYTKDCATETIEIASTDNLELGFNERTIIYQCNESVDDDSIITYNAKLHRFPNDDDYYFSYNVNTKIVENLIDADIYYPRWLRLKKSE